MDDGLQVAKADWERKQLQRRMERTVANTLKKYVPGRGTKHAAGTTKTTVAARKAKNRKKSKANRRNR